MISGLSSGILINEFVELASDEEIEDYDEDDNLANVGGSNVKTTHF